VTLRVLFDATSLPPRPAGVGIYVLNLIRELGRMDGGLELNVVAKSADVERLSAGSGVRLHPVSFRTRPARLLWEQTGLPRLARRLDAGLIHGPHYSLPLRTRIPGVVTFHDPTFFTNPELHERAKVLFFRQMAPMATRRAARVIAVSEYARRAAIQHAGADPDRVDVVYLGIDLARYRPDGDPEEDAAVRARLGVHDPYFFWLGTIEPRKNVPAVVAAFESLATSGLDGLLVLGGQPGWGASDLERAIGRSGVSGRVIRPGYISEEEKMALYRGARALVYPSLAEGFGVQVLEAMAVGCPVITTTGSAPEEVGGDAVTLVPPGDVGALRAAMERVMAEPELTEALRVRGLERALRFGWERTARGTLETYRKASLKADA
jgi:glycosyltransferase involved in cell wall biosynthesis